MNLSHGAVRCYPSSGELPSRPWQRYEEWDHRRTYEEEYAWTPIA